MELKIKNVQMIEVQDWNEFVSHVYKRPYNFQQQDDCKHRGTHRLDVPDKYATECDYERDTIPEEVNGDVMGVSFKAWLERDPSKKLPAPDNQDYCIDLFWGRNFYPAIEMITNDLHEKGLLPKGQYIINIDW